MGNISTIVTGDWLNVEPKCGDTHFIKSLTISALAVQ
jgi:hypothetical protein